MKTSRLLLVFFVNKVSKPLLLLLLLLLLPPCTRVCVFFIFSFSAFISLTSLQKFYKNTRARTLPLKNISTR
jgi:hypothetical protein